MSTSGRLLACLVVVAAVATAPASTLEQQLALIVAAGACWGLNRPAWRPLLRRSLVALPVVVSLLLPLLIEQQFRDALERGLRALCAVVCSLSFAGRLELHRLPGALKRLGVPTTLAQLLAATLRQLTAVREEGRRILLARRLRGASGHWLNTDVLASLLSSTARRGERIELALRLRGGRALWQRESFAAPDAPVLAACLLGSLALHRHALQTQLQAWLG